ncbi:MAG: glycoside hydrolase family 32 protein [Bacteroidota bacterium]
MPDSSVERYRPAFHYTPRQHFVNDPNGCVYLDGEWHLFYQHNPIGTVWGHMSWGHAVSTDLVHWEELPVAIPEADGVMAFSGSAVVDRENTAGFGRDALVCIYTGHSEERKVQDQRLAYSTDRGRTWMIYEGNPVLDEGREHFRDPKVFWHEETARWIMAVVRAEDLILCFYASDDLKAWTLLSTFGEAEDGTCWGVPGAPNWECPDLFELEVEGEPGESRWILKIDVADRALAGGSGGHYLVGHFDGTAFHAETPPEKLLWLDHGRDFYAGQSWNHAPGGRRVWLAWMNNWRYANVTPTDPWRGQFTAPRDLRLVRTPRVLRLRQRPAPEIAALRAEAAVERADWTLPPGVHEVDASGDVLDIEAVFETGSASRVGLRVREGSGQTTILGYDVTSRRAYLDRIGAGEHAFHVEFPDVHTGIVRQDAEGCVRLRALVDRCSVEAFWNDGEAIFTDLVFPDPSSQGIQVFAEGGEVVLCSLRVWPLAP